jgi:hypothetical protein
MGTPGSHPIVTGNAGVGVGEGVKVGVGVAVRVGVGVGVGAGVAHPLIITNKTSKLPRVIKVPLLSLVSIFIFIFMSCLLFNSDVLLTNVGICQDRVSK